MENKYAVELTLRAQSDLRDIAAFHLVKVGPVSAKNVTTAILDQIELLGAFPEMGSRPMAALIAEASFRYIVVRKYLCFYSVTGETVYVHHIVHGSTDYIKRLFE